MKKRFLPSRTLFKSFRLVALTLIFLSSALFFAVTPASASGYRVLIPFEYEYLHMSNEGVVIVNVGGAQSQYNMPDGGEWKILDISGNEIASLPYDWVGGFQEGLSWFVVDDKCGFIDTAGNEVIAPIYDNVYAFSDGIARVILDGLWGYIDKNGFEIVPPICEVASPFSEGLAAIWAPDVLGNDWFYIDENGEPVLSVPYLQAGDFSDGLASFITLDGDRELFGFIDRDGNEVIAPKYDEAGDFDDGYAWVSINGKYGYIDKTGKEVVPLIYDDCSSGFSDGLAAVNLGATLNDDRYLTGGLWGFVDTSGEVVIELQYQYVSGFNYGLSSAFLDDKAGFINTDGETVVPHIYTAVAEFGNDGFAPVAVDELIGIIDTGGNVIIEPQFENISQLEDGLATVMQNGKWGVIAIGGTTPSLAIDLSGADDWAHAEIVAAFEAGLLPDSILNGGWKNPTSRLTAAEAVVQLIETSLGETMEAIASERGWDLDTGHFADTESPEVTFLRYAGITDGFDGVNYIPDGDYNRAQIVTMIGRAAEVFFGAVMQTDNPFGDVPDWASPYVGYAAANNITQGRSATVFDPDGVLENQQTAVFLYRAYVAWR